MNLYVGAAGVLWALDALRRRGRYSLFAGDVGVALSAADCLDERSDYPITDTWASKSVGLTTRELRAAANATLSF
jgi:hypothetical protein